VLDPASPSYQCIDGILGTFAVSIENVRRFADGVKVTINLGNLSSATHTDSKLNLRYGRRMPDDFAKYDAWETTLQTREVSTQQRAVGSRESTRRPVSAFVRRTFHRCESKEASTGVLAGSFQRPSRLL
jgi:hypothetical protein